MKKLVTQHKAVLSDLFDCYIYNEGAIYSFERVDEATLPQDLESEIKGIPYKLSVEFNSEVTFDDQNGLLFFRAFVNVLQREANLKQVRGGKYFDPTTPIDLEGAQMYQAYYNSIKAVAG